MTAPQDPFTPPAQGAPPPTGPVGPPAGYDAPGHGAPAYGAPAYGAPAYGTRTGPPRNGLGTAALVLGVLALLTGLFFVGGLLGLVAIVLGVLGRGRAKRGEATNKGAATAGIVLGLLGVLLSAAVIAGVASFLGSDAGQDLQDCLERAGSDRAAQQQCSADLEGELTQ